MRELIVIAGVPIDDLNMEEALDRIEDFILSRRPHQIATVNTDFIVKAWDDPELRHILQDSDMLTADGMPMVWGARLLGTPLEGRVTGADLVPALAERGAQKGWRIYFLGARPGIAARAAEILKERYPSLQVAGVYSPPPNNVIEMEADLVERVRQAHPDILLVAFGNPKQEKWIHMHLAELDVPVCIGIGGTLDFIAGEVRRAPPWMQKNGLEWLYRLLQEPRRMWQRYVVDIYQFSRFFAIQWLWQRSGRKFPLIEPDIKTEGLSPDQPPDPTGMQELTLSLSGPITVAYRQTVQSQIESKLTEVIQQGLDKRHPSNPCLTLDMSQVVFVDSAAFGMLVALTKLARSQGADLRLRGIQPAVFRSMKLMNLDQFLTVVEPMAVDSTASRAQPIVKSTESRVGVQQMVDTDHLKAPSSRMAALPSGCFTHMLGGWMVIHLPSRLDVENAAGIRTEIEQAVEENTHIIVDFSDTRFLDSSGIAALLGGYRLARQRGGDLRLASLARDARRSLELAGMIPDRKRPGDNKAVQVFQVYETIQLASTTISTDEEHPTESAVTQEEYR